VSQSRHRVRRPKGQVLPLACVTLLLLAISTSLSFTIANVIHEKIRLQNYSDAQAFSMATIEARAFNYVAYSNRASAAAFVTICSLHAFLAIANMGPPLLRAAAIAMFVEMIAEIGVCVATWGEKCCDHIEPPAQQGADYFSDASDAENDLQGWDRPFNDAINGLWEMVEVIHLEQDMVLGGAALKTTQGLSGALKGTAIHAGSLPVGVGALNALALTGSLEGSHLDSESAKKSVSDRSKLYSEIINASRPEFSHNILDMGITDWPPFIGKHWENLTYSIPFWMGKTHGLADSVCDVQVGVEGKVACAEGGSFASFIGSREDLPGVGGWSGSMIASDENGGKHDPNSAHQEDHDKFKGIPKCVEDKNCFINFRLGDKDKLYGQPSVYAYYSMDLTTRPIDSTDQRNTPWELGTNGTLNMEMAGKDKNGDGVKLVMVPERQGSAMSRALVYFHGPGQWPREPNFFDPFWGAKLHPFDRETMEEVLGAAADKFEDMEMAGVIVEGDSL
jgi:hypothetical protein